MLVIELFEELFPNGGEAYAYSNIKQRMLMLGLSPRQIAGVVGAAVRYFGLRICYFTASNEAVFVR